MTKEEIIKWLNNYIKECYKYKKHCCYEDINIKEDIPTDFIDDILYKNITNEELKSIIIDNKYLQIEKANKEFKKYSEDEETCFEKYIIILSINDKNNNENKTFIKYELIYDSWDGYNLDSFTDFKIVKPVEEIIIVFKEIENV